MKNLVLGASAALLGLACSFPALAADADTFRTIAVAEATADPEFSATVLPVEVADMADFEDGILHEGDEIAFELKGVAESSVYILNLDMAGEVRMIFPNDYDDANEPGDVDELAVPAADMQDTYKFVVTIPEGADLPGTELIKIIVARGDYSALEDMLYEYFDKQEPFPKAITPVEDIAEGLSDFAVEHGETQFTEATIEFEVQ